MREMYDRAGEMASSTQDESESTMTGSDPFYDRFHWFKLVGRYVVITSAPGMLRALISSWMGFVLECGYKLCSHLVSVVCVVLQGFLIELKYSEEQKLFFITLPVLV